MPGRLKLGEILVRAGAISQAQLEEALQDQRRYGGRLGTILLERRYISEKIFFKALSAQLKIGAVDFSKSSIPEAICRMVPVEVAEKHAVFPVATKRTPSGNILVLAMADPTNVEAQDEIRFSTGFKVEPLLGLENTIRMVIREFWYEQEGRGSYRYRPDIELAAGAPEKAEEEPFQVFHAESARASQDKPARPAPAKPPGKAPAPAEPARTAGDMPQLNREMKTLLKLLVRKGLITQQEYLELFKET